MHLDCTHSSVLTAQDADSAITVKASDARIVVPYDADGHLEVGLENAGDSLCGVLPYQSG